MKIPRNVGQLLLLATALTVTIAAAPRANGELSLASMSAPTAAESQSGATILARKGCRFGQRYSTYYRRCVLWTPFDLN
jgi:hypothetical protein